LYVIEIKKGVYMDITNLTTNNIDQCLKSFISDVELNELDVKCGLNHGVPIEENPLAIDYLCQSFGDMSSGVYDATIQIPICSSCLVSLYSEFQLLLICINCISSQWVFKPESNLRFKDSTKIVFLTSCPKCYEEGVYVKFYEV
jgi:hypothetical protein